jgi:hypothetical protein
MALLNLVYREQLFPRRVYALAFDALLAGIGERSACRERSLKERPRLQGFRGAMGPNIRLGLTVRES